VSPRTAVAAAVAALAALISQNARAADAIAAHPRDLKFEPLKFDVPKADAYKFTLKTGQTAYVVEDHSLPLVNIQITMRAGSFLDPKDKPGVAGLTGGMMRLGGTQKMTAEEFDEAADFLAANMGTYIGDTSGGANLDCLSRNLDAVLDLFFDMMKTPRFQQDRLDIQKGQILEGMKQRNDDADSILGREWNWLIYGPDHFSVRQQTKAQLDSITREDLIAFHKTWWRPSNMILAISGDVDAKAIVANLSARFAGWNVTGAPVPWPPPAPEWTIKPGLYHVEKDIPQGKVSIGHLGTVWSNPDQFALQVMNDILGGGGFTSRITKTVRSNEGLAYHASSTFGIGTWFPTDFSIDYQSKNPTVALAAKLALEEVKKIRTEPVGAEELETSKNGFIESFPRRFDSKRAMANLWAQDDFIGRPHSYWEAWRDNIRKVSAADVQRVAQKYLQTDKIAFLVVGKWSEIEPGDPNGRASMKEFFGGQVIHLPLRDPLTLQPMK